MTLLQILVSTYISFNTQAVMNHRCLYNIHMLFIQMIF